jgi:hypothetical protein
MFRAGLYARVSTNDQQTLAMQSRAMREYAARRSWTIRSASPRGELRGRAAERSRENPGSRAPPGHRRGAGLAVGSVGRSVTDLLATLQELEHLGPRMQEQFRQQLARFDAMPKAQQQVLVRRAERFASLSKEAKAAVQRQMQALRALP